MEIDYIATGANLKNRIRIAGYDIKYIKEYLNLNSVQSIYKWQRGESLPTVEHLYKLSVLLGTTIDDLIMIKVPNSRNILKRLWTYDINLRYI